MTLNLNMDSNIQHFLNSPAYPLQAYYAKYLSQLLGTRLAEPLFSS